MKSRLAAAVIATVALLMSSCSVSKSNHLAEAGVETFHQRYSAKDYTAIYKDAGKEFQQAETSKDFEELMVALQDKLGAVESSSRKAWNTSWNNGISTVRAEYETKFVRGAAIESFVWRISGGEAKLLGYHINSRALIINKPSNAPTQAI
ncbi:MAG: hypothetical protein JO317_06780 [Verrucomicrobiae bacterium]|nr:hypothetical protein [Verrucomicrobiae bacterium]